MSTDVTNVNENVTNVNRIEMTTHKLKREIKNTQQLKKITNTMLRLNYIQKILKFTK